MPSRARALTAVAGALLLLGGLGLQLRPHVPPLPLHQPRAVAAVRPAAVVPPWVARERAVRALLDVRARALNDRDLPAFLGTVDPQARAFRARQAAQFAALGGVPASGWTYLLDPRREQPRSPDLDVRYGTWWAPQLLLRYRLRGIDPVPAAAPQSLTFAARGGRWYVAADRDFPAAQTPAGLWDGGPVVPVRTAAVLVLGHPGHEALLHDVADAVQAALPRVTRVWGDGWAQRVAVLVPHDAGELARLVPGADLSQLVAVATADPLGGTAVGQRLVVNPQAYAGLTPLGRRVVLTHEVVHVATRASTGPAAPAWLVEGFADHVAYLNVPVPLHISAHALRGQVRAGQLPATLPRDADFDGANPHLQAVYEQAWLAVDLMARRYGEARTAAFYRAAGRSVPAAFRDVLGTSEAAFTRAWQASLRARLS